MCNRRRYHSAVILPIERDERGCSPGENRGGGRRFSLSPAQCHTARAIFAEEGTVTSVARYFGVSRNCAYQAIHGHRHPAVDKHVGRISRARSAAVDQNGVALPTYQKRLRRAARAVTININL